MGSRSWQVPWKWRDGSAAPYSWNLAAIKGTGTIDNRRDRCSELNQSGDGVSEPQYSGWTIVISSCYGVSGLEFADSWSGFFEMLRRTIGSPQGQMISKDADRVIDNVMPTILSNRVTMRSACAIY